MDLLATHQAQVHSLAKEDPSTQTGREDSASAPAHPPLNRNIHSGKKYTEDNLQKKKQNKKLANTKF